MSAEIIFTKIFLIKIGIGIVKGVARRNSIIINRYFEFKSI